MAKNCENNSDFNKPTAVFAMLDWGLGHVSRTIPIIKTLQQLNWNIVIACDSNQYKILFPLFPTAEFQTLPGYQISFGKTRVKTLLKIIGQSIKILTKIKLENKWITLFLRERKAQLIISDNRYGFYNSTVPSVLITHQLNIKSGLGALVDRLLAFLNKKHLSKFHQIWVPDSSNSKLALAGTLSEPLAGLSTPVHYIGPISRLSANPISTKKRKYLAILSGPEPQRTIFESLLTVTFLKNQASLTMVCGRENDPSESQQGTVEKIGFVHPDQLNELIASSEYIISRSGYSSLMDYAFLQCKSILVPTPGQAEQEYLAKRFAALGLAASIKQNDFDFDAVERITAATTYATFNDEQQFNEAKLKSSILECLHQLQLQ